MTLTPSGPPAGWYDDGTRPGMQRWWDGTQYTDHYQAVASASAGEATPAHTSGPMTSASLNVNREVIYTRQQQGHSIILHVLLGIFVLWINVIYITVSPNHYWRA
jgi:hypothetical protein